MSNEQSQKILFSLSAAMAVGDVPALRRGVQDFSRLTPNPTEEEACAFLTVLDRIKDLGDPQGAYDDAILALDDFSIGNLAWGATADRALDWAQGLAETQMESTIISVGNVLLDIDNPEFPENTATRDLAAKAGLTYERLMNRYVAADPFCAVESALEDMDRAAAGSLLEAKAQARIVHWSLWAYGLDNPALFLRGLMQVWQCGDQSDNSYFFPAREAFDRLAKAYARQDIESCVENLGLLAADALGMAEEDVLGERELTQEAYTETDFLRWSPLKEALSEQIDRLAETKLEMAVETVANLLQGAYRRRGVVVEGLKIRFGSLMDRLFEESPESAFPSLFNWIADEGMSSTLQQLSAKKLVDFADRYVEWDEKTTYEALACLVSPSWDRSGKAWQKAAGKVVDYADRYAKKDPGMVFEAMANIIKAPEFGFVEISEKTWNRAAGKALDLAEACLEEEPSIVRKTVNYIGREGWGEPAGRARAFLKQHPENSHRPAKNVASMTAEQFLAQHMPKAG